MWAFLCSFLWQAGLRGVGMPAALLEVANGRYSGNLAAFHGLRLLIPTGFNRMFGTMSLPEAITSAGTLNCFAAAVAAQLAPLPPFELTLQAKQSMRFQVCLGNVLAMCLAPITPIMPASTSAGDFLIIHSWDMPMGRVICKHGAQ